MKGHYMKNLLLNKSSYIFSIFRKFNILLLSILFLLFSVIIFNSSVFAMTPSCYGYDKIKKALPEKYQKSEYLRQVNGVTYLAFCKYKNASDDYLVSVKHNNDEFCYCVNYGSHFTADKKFVLNSKLFDDDLKARIGLAMQLGTVKWNEKAMDGYSTGHFLTDYYMTQYVIHGLIYKYATNKKDHGIDFNSLSFKDGTGDLKKKTTSLFKTCCNAKFTSKKGYYQNAVFSFDKSKEIKAYYDDEQTAIVSDNIDCITDKDNGAVSTFIRSSCLKNDSGETIVNNAIVDQGGYYNSPFSFFVPIEHVKDLDVGKYTAEVEEKIVFSRGIVQLWKCSEEKFKDNQEVCGLSYNDTEVSDKKSVSFTVNKIYINKRDSISNDVIADAEFKLMQYDNSVNDYVFYKYFEYDTENQRYESGNIINSKNNPERRYKIIESKAGENYINDWNGEEFIMTDDVFIYEFNVLNSPVLGSFHLKKYCDDFSFDENDGHFNNSSEKIKVPNIKFSLYAADDIYLKDKVIYKKDQKIIDFVTDDNGEAVINSLLPGKYYFKEDETNILYVLPDGRVDFEITYSNNKYSTFEYSMNNNLKKCRLMIYKYTGKEPLEGCKFGIYAKNDICNAIGSVIVKKDTLIKEAVTDKDGIISFDKLIFADYYLKELNVPNGIIKNDDIIDVSKEQFELIADTDNEYGAKLNVYNQKQEYIISLFKYGEQFVKAEEVNDHSGTYYKYIVQNQPLKNVKFSLYDNKGNIIDTKETGENGLIEFSKLEYGDYICKEVYSPTMYEFSSKPVEIKCRDLKKDNTNKDSKNKAIEIKKEFYNKLCNINLKILKLGEKAVIKDNKLTFEQVPLEGVVYGIYQDFDYTFTSGEKLNRSSCVGYIITGSDGTGTFTGVVPEGKYYLKELNALPGYELDNENHYFDVKAKDNKQIIVDLSNNPYINVLSKSFVKIIKTDENTHKKLKGVEFTLYNEKDQRIGIYKTNSKGEIIVDKLPYGNYYFIETKCKKGYYSSNNKYSFILNSSKGRVLEISNTPILKLGFNENYKLYLIILCCITTLMYIYLIKRKNIR